MSSSVALVRRLFAVALAAAVVLTGIAGIIAAAPFTVPGSSQHSSPLSSLLAGCPNDDGESVSDGQSAPGAQQRCVAEAERRLVTAGVLVAVGALEVAIAATVVARRSAAPRRRPTNVSPT